MAIGSIMEYPRAADLHRDVYRPLPSIVGPLKVTDEESAAICLQALYDLDAALASGNKCDLEGCFYEPQIYWTDLLALTWNLRTIYGSREVANALGQMNQERHVTHLAMIPGSSKIVNVSPSLPWLACQFTFQTTRPSGHCRGKLMLLPRTSLDGSKDWKIWVLGTWLQDLVDFPQDPARLELPLPNQETENRIETDVLIVGGGNSGICLAARLKALGVRHLVVDRNARVGDNWRNRYDCMRLHIHKGVVSLPFSSYPDEAPIYLTREHLADHLENYARRFDLNVQLLTTVESTEYDDNSRSWRVKLNTLHDTKLVSCKQLVLATGAGCQIPWQPDVESFEMYKGVSLHSVEFQNGKVLRQQGVKSALVIGSANTAFDVMNDCHAAGLKTTMVQRAATYLLPEAYLPRPSKESIDPENDDANMNATPLAISGQLARNLHMALAASEPDRYKQLSKAGFLVDTSGDINYHILVRAGGHYVDFEGGTLPIASGAVGIKSGVVPTSFTASGLQFSDGTHLDADAVIWCTGFADKNMKYTVSSILGVGGDYISSKMDAVWGVDKEGQVRGAWKQQKNLPDFWVMCGIAAHHRYRSKLLAMQIKMAVEGRLPAAYTDEPDKVQA